MPTRPMIWGTLVAVCCAVLPVPIAVMPASDSQTVTGKPGPAFPCQNRPCGCKSPHQCWTQCCCFGPAQRLAWAKRNQVKPPVYAILEEPKSNVVAASSQAKPACCATTKPCCQNKVYPAPSAKRSCCDKKARAEEPQSNESSETRWLISVMALKCRGLSTDVTSLPWTILSDLLVPLAVVPIEVVPIPILQSRPSVVSLLDSPPPRV